MSEHIVHTALVEHSAALVRRDEKICEPFKSVLESHLDEASLGGSTRHGDLHNPGILTTIRDGWPSRKPDDLLETKLAFVLGWITHRAASAFFTRDIDNHTMSERLDLGRPEVDF